MNDMFFCIWGLLTDEAVHALELSFLLDTTGAEREKWHMPVWLAVNGMMIVAAIRFRIPGMFLWDVLFLLLFPKLALHVRWERLATPAAILFTLYTFMEGFSAVLMSWLSRNIRLPKGGYGVQALLSVSFSLLFFLCLRLIRKKYLAVLKHPVSSCLYILLLPCGLIVLAVRYGLRLDGSGFEAWLSTFGAHATLGVLLLMTAAVALFFLITEAFCRILSLTWQEREAALLRSQREGWRIYMEEARKRNEQYASFRHDLANHLLVLSGLLRDKNYEEAEIWAGKLHGGSILPSVHVSTGSLVLDTLLTEKISHAGRVGIETDCRVWIPDTFHADDMDLCVIFANLMDNAIHACEREEGEKPFLTIFTQSRAGLLVIEAANSCSSASPVKFGTGLENVRTVAGKYQGTLKTEKRNGIFRISVLLCARED